MKLGELDGRSKGHLFKQKTIIRDNGRNLARLDKSS